VGVLCDPGIAGRRHPARLSLRQEVERQRTKSVQNVSHIFTSATSVGAFMRRLYENAGLDVKPIYRYYELADEQFEIEDDFRTKRPAWSGEMSSD